MPFDKRDFEQRLEDSGIIPVVGEINNDSASRIIFKLLAYSTANENREIQLYFSSVGGSYLDVMAIYDTLAAIKNPITGVCVGHVSGFATLLLAKCTKGKRYALKHSELAISQPYAFLAPGSNQQTEIAIEAREAFLKREIFERELSLCTGNSVQKVHDDCENGSTFSPVEAKAYGIIDEIL